MDGWMKALLAAALALIPATITEAQTPVFSIQGPITPGNCVVWIDALTIGDSGAPCPSSSTCAFGGTDLSQSGCNIAWMGG
jgi:hypothetical protein